MRNGVLASLGVVASVLLSTCLPVFGQSALPRTPWGDPDLQGMWANNNATPLQRPEAFAGKETLTDGDDRLVTVPTQVVEPDRDRAAFQVACNDPSRDLLPIGEAPGAVEHPR